MTSAVQQHVSDLRASLAERKGALKLDFLNNIRTPAEKAHSTEAAPRKSLEELIASIKINNVYYSDTQNMTISAGLPHSLTKDGALIS